MNEPWDIVHSVDDWYDGPLDGVADFRGARHHFRKLDLAVSNEQDDRFVLTPLSAETTTLEEIDTEVVANQARQVRVFGEFEPGCERVRWWLAK